MIVGIEMVETKTVRYFVDVKDEKQARGLCKRLLSADVDSIECVIDATFGAYAPHSERLRFAFPYDGGSENEVSVSLYQSKTDDLISVINIGGDWHEMKGEEIEL